MPKKAKLLTIDVNSFTQSLTQLLIFALMLTIFGRAISSVGSAFGGGSAAVPMVKFMPRPKGLHEFKELE